VQPSSVRHIARTWFGNQRAIVLRSLGLTSAADVAKPAAAPKRDDCRSIDTYLSDVAPPPVPSTDAVHFGQLRADTGK